MDFNSDFYFLSTYYVPGILSCSILTKLALYFQVVWRRWWLISIPMYNQKSQTNRNPTIYRQKRVVKRTRTRVTERGKS